MVQNTSWEANWCAASQEFPRILGNPKVHCLIHKCPPSVPFLSQLNPVRNSSSHFQNIILILSSHLRLGLTSDLFPSGFTHQNPVYPTPLPHTCYIPCPAHSSRTILGEGYKSSSSLLCSFLHSPVTLSLSSQIFSSTAYSQTPSAYVPSSTWATKFHTHTKQREKLQFGVS
jgi:hypothetical protein